jgi:hypothetical protein
VSTPDDQLVEANWERMRTALTDAAREYRRLADSLERIPFENSRGRRSPEGIISEVSLTAHTNTAATLIHRLVCWAETINEIQRRQASAPEGTISSRILCDYTITDPDRSCVLTAGHSWPKDDGLTAHMSESGVMFA